MLFWSSPVSAQRLMAGNPQTFGVTPRTEITYPAAVEGLCPPRPDFFSYSTSPVAQRGDIADEFFYKPVTDFTTERTDSSTIYTASVMLSARWLGRSTRIHTEGARRTHRVWINDIYLGCSTDSRLPSEFSVGTNLVENMNRVTIEVMDGADPVSTLPDNRAALTEVYFVSQPMAHIADYEIRSRIDSLGRGYLELTITIENGYNMQRPIAAGCVVTMPDGRTNGYIPIEKQVKARSTEKFKFDIEIQNPKIWSVSSPNLYPILMYVRFGGQIVEYVPIRGAFVAEQNGAQEREATRFNVSADRTATTKKLKELKKEGITLLATDYPQPSWFYDVCDELGIEVIECANIHAEGDINARPEFTAEFERRVEAMYRRIHQHPCIVSYRASTAEMGTNYALWRAYLKLKELDSRGVLRTP